MCLAPMANEASISSLLSKGGVACSALFEGAWTVSLQTLLISCWSGNSTVSCVVCIFKTLFRSFFDFLLTCIEFQVKQNELLFSAPNVTECFSENDIPISILPLSVVCGVFLQKRGRIWKIFKRLVSWELQRIFLQFVSYYRWQKLLPRVQLIERVEFSSVRSLTLHFQPLQCPRVHGFHIFFLLRAYSKLCCLFSCRVALRNPFSNKFSLFSLICKS